MWQITGSALQFPYLHHLSRRYKCYSWMHHARIPRNLQVGSAVSQSFCMHSKVFSAVLLPTPTVLYPCLSKSIHCSKSLSNTNFYRFTPLILAHRVVLSEVMYALPQIFVGHWDMYMMIYILAIALRKRLSDPSSPRSLRICTRLFTTQRMPILMQKCIGSLRNKLPQNLIIWNLQRSP